VTKKQFLFLKRENWESLMSDWELFIGAPTKTKELSKSSSDWQIVPSAPSSQQSQPNEGLGIAALKAIPRVAEDIYRGGMGFIKNIPEYYQSAQTEIPGVFSALKQHPKHALMQALAGSQELINNLAQSPRGLASYAENRLNLLPKGSEEFVGKHLVPENTSQAINELFGQPQYEGEKLLRGLGRNALNLYGAGKLASVLNPLKLTDKSLVKDVLKTREKNIGEYTGHYNKFWKEAENKGFGDALYNVDIDIPSLKKYSPGKSIQGVMDFNKNPTLENAHTAKSDLLRLQRELNKKTTLNTAERNQKMAVDSAIDSIKNNMFKNEKGQIDPKMLEKYEAIQKGYANEVIPYKNKAINEFLRNESSEKELLNSLSKRAFARKRGEHHPRMVIKNKLRNHPYLASAGLLGLGGLLYKDIMGHKTPEQ